MSFDVGTYLYSPDSKEAIRYGYTDSLFPRHFNKNKESMLLSAFLAKNKNLKVCLDGDPEIDSKETKILTTYPRVGWSTDDTILYIAINFYIQYEIDHIFDLWNEEEENKEF